MAEISHRRARFESMEPVLKHTWRLPPRQAVILQRMLADRVIRRSTCDLRRLSLVVGTDVSYSKVTDTCYGAAVVWDYRRGRQVAAATAVRRARFPYVPGLLSFREAPVLVAALAKLTCLPDLLLVEGQGLAHPRRFGLASHLGVLYDLPAVGCAKKRLVGQHGPLGSGRGSRTLLKDKAEVVGAVLRTRSLVRPVYVSPGHRIAVEQCCRVIARLSGRARLPDPLRCAHALANQQRQRNETG